MKAAGLYRAVVGFDPNNVAALAYLTFGASVPGTGVKQAGLTNTLSPVPSGFRKIEPPFPTRKRADYNPLNREEYMLHILHAY